MTMARSAMRTRLFSTAVMTSALLLAGCGGSNGGVRRPPPVNQPAPAPTPAPTPTPTPTPPPSTGAFDTAEFRLSDGPDQHGAVTAWQQGATGIGSIIAIIDTGIDEDSPEFAGRIHPDSRDLVANRGFNAEDDHGTNVALVAAAARNNTGILGIAYGASILALRGDQVGSCGSDTPEDTDLDCSFSDRDIARGIDQAVASGATVINISLGGGNPTQATRDAVARAAAAGVVIVVAAGNAGDGSVSGVNPNEPTNFARGLREAGGENVIIVGSVDEGSNISAFSQRAGSQANWFLTARGERICCVYENGRVFVGQDEQGSFRLVFSGTSFATPQVAGAVALMKQAFPNLTGQQIVKILLETARDRGDAGIDPTYGRGVLDIAAAFAPQGQTMMAGGTSVVRLGATSVTGSAAMGDALNGGTQSVEGIVLDKYRRAYAYDFGSATRGAQQSLALHHALTSKAKQVSAGAPGLAMAFTVADRHDGLVDEKGIVRPMTLSEAEAEGARVLAGRMIAAIAPGTTAAFGLRQSAGGLAASLQGSDRPAFMIAGAGQGGGLGIRDAAGVAVRHELEGWGLTATAQSGSVDVASDSVRSDWQPGRGETGLTSLALAADRSFGPLDTVFGLTLFDEEATILGAQFDDSFGANGAKTLFVDASATLHLGDAWRVGGTYRHGFTDARTAGVIAAGSRLQSQAFSFDVARRGIWQTGDSLALRIAQPLRVSSGGVNVTLPVAYDYADEQATFGTRRFSLAPTGREMIGELRWTGSVLGGSGGASIFYRTDPGHYADSPHDAGAAVTWSKTF